jgi:glucose/arabinose dehydrogenase
MTKIIRGRLKENAFVDQETIFEAPAGEYTSRNIHFGNRMEFDAKEFLYFSIGDRGDSTTPANNAQKLTNPKGKNYGWPIVTFGINYDGTTITNKTSAPGMESPVIHWTP